MYTKEEISERRLYKVNIFAEMIHSIYDIKSYAGFQKNSGLKTVLYGVVLDVIVIFFTLFLPLILLLVPVGGIEGFGRESVPEFTLEDGEFWIEEPLEYKQYNPGQGSVLIKADTDSPITEEITKVDLLAYDQAIVMDAHHVLLKLNGSGATRFTYGELDLGDWDRDRLFREAMPYIRVLFWGLVIILLWIMLIAFFGGALVVAWIGKLMASMQSRDVTFGSLYKMAIHSRTTPLLIKMIYMWIPVTIPFFLLINVGISCVYMWRAIAVTTQEEEPTQIIL